MNSTFLQRFFEEMQQFCESMISDLNAQAFSAESCTIDHVCYRVPTTERYEFVKTELKSVGSIISEALVNGRPIATIKLFTPVTLSTCRLDVVEIPAPKPTKFYAEGFEHLEAVVPDSLESFVARFPNSTFDTSNMGAKINRDIAVQLKSGLVKFHEASLESIIALEEKIGS